MTKPTRAINARTAIVLAPSMDSSAPKGQMAATEFHPMAESVPVPVANAKPIPTTTKTEAAVSARSVDVLIFLRGSFSAFAMIYASLKGTISMPRLLDPV